MPHHNQPSKIIESLKQIGIQTICFFTMPSDSQIKNTDHGKSSHSEAMFLVEHGLMFLIKTKVTNEDHPLRITLNAEKLELESKCMVDVFHGFDEESKKVISVCDLATKSEGTLEINSMFMLFGKLAPSTSDSFHMIYTKFDKSFFIHRDSRMSMSVYTFDTDSLFKLIKNPTKLISSDYGPSQLSGVYYTVRDNVFSQNSPKVLADIILACIEVKKAYEIICFDEWNRSKNEMIKLHDAIISKSKIDDIIANRREIVNRLTLYYEKAVKKPELLRDLQKIDEDLHKLDIRLETFISSTGALLRHVRKQIDLFC